MRDKYFEYFISKFGEATHRVDVPNEAIEKWRGKLPDQLLTYWKEEGWCGYANGLFWTVNPHDYEDLVDEWLADSPLEQIDVFHAIGRTAFGDLYLCSERRGYGITLCSALNAVSTGAFERNPQTPQDMDWSIRSFFSGSSASRHDCADESGVPLFNQTLKILGPLAPDEMYGFEPAIVLGGQMKLENLRKVNLDVHLTILRQFAAPTMPFANIDIDALIRST